MGNHEQFNSPDELRRLANLHLRSLAVAPLVDASAELETLLDTQREQIQKFQDSAVHEKKLQSHARSVLNTQREIEHKLNRAILFSRLTRLSTEAPTDLRELAKHHEPLFSAIFPPEIAFTFTVPPNLDPVDIPESVLIHTLVCLCINAREAMEENGMVAIRVEASNTPLLAPNTSTGTEVTPPKPPYVLITVTDTGEGVKPEIHDRMFEAFTTSKQTPPHSGLSLFLCRRLLALHGAMIQCTKSVFESTTFELALPLCKPQPAPSAVATPAHPKSTLPIVLVVEDEQALRRLLVKQIHNMGLHVLEGENGIDALDKIEEQQPNLILAITDIMMPEMGGIELVNTLRLSQPELPAIFISGYIDTAGTDDDERHRLNRYIRKPFPLRMLSEKIRELLPDI
jgi:two-component system cell cycle sensor histidine kinase/response regulator CckA